MSNIKPFEQKSVRSVYNEQEEKWYFSIVDVVEVLTFSPNIKGIMGVFSPKEIEEIITIIKKIAA